MVFGCQEIPDNRLWAIDSIWLAEREGETTGFQTWTVYDAPWRGLNAERHHICTHIVSLRATPINPCTDCTNAWDIVPDGFTSDCTDDVQSAGDWGGIRGISLAVLGMPSVPNSPDNSVPVLAYSVTSPDWEPYGWTEDRDTENITVTSPWVWQLQRTP